MTKFMNDGNSNLDSLISFYLIISIVGVIYLFIFFIISFFYIVNSCSLTVTDKHALPLKFIYPLVPFFHLIYIILKKEKNY